MSASQAQNSVPTSMRVLSTAERGRRLRVQAHEGSAQWAINASSASVEDGDRALIVTGSDGTYYAIGIVPHRPRPTANFESGSLVVRNASGEVVLEMDESSSSVRLVSTHDLEVAAPAGDLALSAGGRVRVSGGTGVDIATTGAVRAITPGASWVVGSGELQGRSQRLDLASSSTRASLGDIAVSGKRASIVCECVHASVRRLESVSTEVICQTRDLFCDVARLAQTTTERMRIVVRAGLNIRTGRTHMRSQQATRIDGEKIHLG